MIGDIRLIFDKEWRSFRASDRSVFILYVIMALLYSLVFATSGQDSGQISSVLWWVFFSVVGGSTFMNQVFVSERIGGQLEILLTSGISRNSIIWGKVLFVLLMSVIIGSVPLGLAALWQRVFANTGLLPGEMTFSWWGPILYVCASFTTTAITAWLSLRLSNPRMVHFFNFILLIALVSAYAAVQLPTWVLAAVLVGIGVLGIAGAIRAIHSEQVVQTITL